MNDQLWAPWRFDYVSKADEASQSDCIFCELQARNSDRDSLILYRGTDAFVLLNAYPYTSGHLMIAPKRHIGEICNLSRAELTEINLLVQQACAWITEVFQPGGFNIGVNIGKAAGAGIPQHLHWHIVPRWAGDTNFMTSVSGVRVIPQDLRVTYDLLKKAVG